MSRMLTYDEFHDRLSSVHGNIIAIDPYIGMNKRIRFQCSKGHVWYADPHNVLRGSGCPYCADKALLIGYNDLWTARPDIAKLLKNPEDGYKYTKASHAKVDFVCPECGKIVAKRINDVYNKRFSCPRCSDGISYPNKFARCFLEQLPIENYDYEYQPNWAKPYFYDNYFMYNNIEYVIEMDGGFHYFERGLTKKSLLDVKNVDKIKTELAMQHGIKMIRIECLESKCDYIRNNILTSELNDIFDLSNIDWKMCDQIAQKSLVKQTCDIYMSGVKDLQDISKILHIARSTVGNYLKAGVEFGWCDYDPNWTKIPVKLIDNNELVVQIFPSIKNA